MSAALYNIQDHVNEWHDLRMSDNKATTEKGGTPFVAVRLNVKIKVTIGHR